MKRTGVAGQQNDWYHEEMLTMVHNVLLALLRFLRKRSLVSQLEFTVYDSNQ